MFNRCFIFWLGTTFSLSKKECLISSSEIPNHPSYKNPLLKSQENEFFRRRKVCRYYIILLGGLHFLNMEYNHKYNKLLYRQQFMNWAIIWRLQKCKNVIIYFYNHQSLYICFYHFRKPALLDSLEAIDFNLKNPDGHSIRKSFQFLFLDVLIEIETHKNRWCD